MAGTRRRPSGPLASDARGRSDGIGRPSSQRAEHVSDDLRRGSDPNLTRRRRIAGLSLTAIGALGTVAAYQTGLIRHLPELPLPGLDADTVDASGEAYVQLVTPDAALGIASYAVTLILAGMGARDRARTQPWIPLALAAKVGSGHGGLGLPWRRAGLQAPRLLRLVPGRDGGVAGDAAAGDPRGPGSLAPASPWVNPPPRRSARTG